MHPLFVFRAYLVIVISAYASGAIEHISVLSQLNEVIELVRSKLEKGITLPAGTKAKVYKSTNDDSADPASALLIYKGCTDHDGNKIDVEMVDSDLHVFTRLHARVTVSHADSLLQMKTFKEMIDRVVAR